MGGTCLAATANWVRAATNRPKPSATAAAKATISDEKRFIVIVPCGGFDRDG